jgi:uncharacterized membrane protein YfcA
LEYFFLFLIGLCGGFFAGLIGIGGGVLYILILPYLLLDLGYPTDKIVQLTIANSLVGTMFAALSANIALIIKREFYWKEVALMGAFSTFLSLLVLNVVVNTPWYQRDKFNYVVIALLVFIAIKTLIGNRKNIQKRAELQMKNAHNGMIGALAGILSALSGLGGGVIIISILTLRFKVDMKKAKSISLGVIFVTSLVMTISNLLENPNLNFQADNIGYIVWPLALSLSGGVVLGSPLGVRFSRRLSNRTISYIFVSFLAVVIIDKLLQLLV